MSDTPTPSAMRAAGEIEWVVSAESGSGPDGFPSRLDMARLIDRETSLPELIAALEAIAARPCVCGQKDGKCDGCIARTALAEKGTA